jgi:hypothetical protein
MRTRDRIAVLLAAVLLSSSLAHADPRPRRWFKDWKWWAGEAFIAGIRAADAHSSVTARSRCPTCNETNIILGNHPSTGALAGMASVGFGVETTLHILSWKYCPNENSRWWRTASYTLVPGIDAAGSIRGIVHNYGLTSYPKTASSSMILGHQQSSISTARQSIAASKLFEKLDQQRFVPLYQISSRRLNTFSLGPVIVGCSGMGTSLGCNSTANRMHAR